MSDRDPSIDRDQIAQFARAVFGNIDGYVPVRLLAEKGGSDRRPELEFLPADNSLPEKLANSAQRAAQLGAGLFVVPGTTKERGKARAQDIVETQVVLVDLDEGDIAAKREHLVRWIGPPSLEVASGGMTNEGHRKVHP